MPISPLMQQLRDELDAAGIEWHDESEEFGWDDYVYHMERTKVTRNWQTADCVQLASCVYGYSGREGHQTGTSYGWPDFIEGWPDGQNDQEPMTIEAIIEAAKAR